MKKELSADILEKYFKGACSDEEIAEVDAWYASFEEDEDDISALPADQQEIYRRLMLNNIRNNIRNTEQDNIVFIKNERPRRFRSFIYIVSGIAAIVLVVFFIKYNVPHNPPAENEKEIVVNNVTNTIQKVILSDGSKVWLSPKTTLTCMRQFGPKSRQVTMTGEAFFEVVKDHARPFSIYSGNVITKVWGTSFRIRSFKNEITKVDVITGKVSVSVAGTDKKTTTDTIYKSDNAQQVMLMPNEEATYDDQLKHLKKNQEIKDPLVSIWKKTSISFDNTPMPEVFRILNKKFNVHISSEDKKVTTDYLKADFTDESFPAIMEIMEKTLNVTYTVNESEFVLKSNK